MLGLQRLDPRPDPEGPGGVGDRRPRREPGRHGGHRPLARAAAREPVRRDARDPAADGRSARASRPASASPTPACTGTTRTSARTTARRWASTATCSWSPRIPDYWPPAHREVLLTLDDILLEDGKVAPFSRAETTYAAMGRFGDVLLVSGETDLVADRAARRGRAPLPHQHRQHARVQGRAAGRADEARRRRQRPRRARAVRRRRRAGAVGARGGRRAVRPGGRADAGAPHARSGLSAGRDQVSDERAEPSLDEQFEVLRTNADMVAERERIAPYLEAEPDKTLAFIAEMDMGGAGRRRAGRLRLPDASRGRQRGARPLPECGMKLLPVEAPRRYTCPMHPEVVSEEPGHCPECGMKLLPASCQPAPRHGGTRRPRATSRRGRRHRVGGRHGRGQPARRPRPTCAGS